MDTRIVRRTRVTLPGLTAPGLYLSTVTSLEGGRGRVTEFSYTDADLRQLDLTDTHLLDGRISRLTAQRARFDHLRVSSVEFSGCELAALHCSGSRLSRVVFTDCRLMGAVWEDTTLDNVLFDSCKLDYSTFSRVRATGPVIFTKCSLRETTFTASDLGSTAFDKCDLHLTEFGGGTYRGCDLRDNELSRVRGTGSLMQVVIDRPQILQLAESLAAELDVTYGEDLNDT